MVDDLAQVEFARELRRNATDAERALWRILGRLRPRFTRQCPIGPYVTDFACRRARLIVEVDGGQHAESDRDAHRTAELVVSGWRVLRYWNNDVLANTEGVALDIIVRGNPRLPPGEQFNAVAPRPARRRQEKEGPPMRRLPGTARGAVRAPHPSTKSWRGD